MVGGRVIEVCDHPTDRSKIYVEVADRPYSKVERCAIYVKRNPVSELIEIGDGLWWQGRVAMWTPQANILTQEERAKRGMKCGDQYDIPIPRIGYSGVSHPVNGGTES